MENPVAYLPRAPVRLYFFYVFTLFFLCFTRFMNLTRGHQLIVLFQGLSIIMSVMLTFCPFFRELAPRKTCSQV